MGSSIPDLDKILKMSEVFGVTTDYLLKEDVAEEMVNTENFADSQMGKKTAKNKKAPRQVCDEEGNAYIETIKRSAREIAIGVAFCILSPICLLLLSGVAAQTSASITQRVRKE
jgi:transcriptional regulator with XRE-family HTH domain